MKAQNRQSGYTLIEIMVVMVIVAVLAGFGMPKLNRYIKSSDTVEPSNFAAGITAGIAAYVSQHHNASMANIKTAINQTFDTLDTSCGTNCIAKMIPVLQLPKNHVWIYKIAVDVDSTEANRRIETCIKIYKSGAETDYILYSSIASAVTTWEGNLFRAPYVYGGAFVAGGACPSSLPSASASNQG